MHNTVGGELDYIVDTFPSGIQAKHVPKEKAQLLLETLLASIIEFALAKEAQIPCEFLGSQCNVLQRKRPTFIRGCSVEKKTLPRLLRIRDVLSPTATTKLR
jgi:hypothetical protein